MSDAPAFVPHLVPIAVNLADEGVPVSVIGRSMRVPNEYVREQLKEAIGRGELIEMPANDWPPTARRRDRVPMPQGGIERVALNCQRAFKVTAQQSSVLAVLLTRDDATKEQLLNAIQHQRVTRGTLPNNMDEPQIKMVDVLICNIRKKVTKVHGIQIKTEWGRGYMISKSDRELAFKLMNDYASDDDTGATNGETKRAA